MNINLVHLLGGGRIAKALGYPAEIEVLVKQACYDELHDQCNGKLEKAKKPCGCECHYPWLQED